MTETGDRLLNPEQKQVNPDNFYVVQGWMRTELNLSGASLAIYAVIYGFSQDKDSYFQGTAKYLAEWSAVSVYTVYDILKKLCQKGLIEKREKEVNGVKVCDYRATQDHHRWQKTTTPVIKDHHPVVIKDHLDNINIDNIQDNIYKKTNTKKAFTKPTLDEIKAYCRQKGISIDCEYFFDYYESNGWKVSNSPMKDWQATVRNWARRNTNWKKEGDKANGVTPGKYAGLGRIVEV